MSRKKPRTFYLFAYGTLMDPSVFRAVTGKDLVDNEQRADGVDSFLAREAILDGYKKVSPDHTYLYAVPDEQGRISGRVIGPLNNDVLKRIRKYEGRNYHLRWLKVLTKDGPVAAGVFIANLKQLEHSFGYEFRDPLKQEFLLEDKIERALKETEEQQLHTDEPVVRRAVGELHGTVIRDLVRRHFEAGGISDYAIRTSLKDAPIRDFTRIADDSEASSLAPHYLSLVIRQVLFNQFEERIRRDFRYELDHMRLSERFYDRTISSLIALRMLNNARELLDMVVADCLTELQFPANHLVDFIRWAIIASDAVYDRKVARQELNFVRHHMGHGYIALGAELEFSDIGHEVIRDPTGGRVQDRRYDGFLYFSDFGLDLLTWKLGGHVDDHHVKTPGRPRRGFFEVALGSLSIEANISKPITDDPWVLNQIIHETRRFFHVAPHSVHISMQMRTQHKPDRDRMLPLGMIKCLFALAGGLSVRTDGSVSITRLATDEILSRGDEPHMLFSEVSKRFSHQGADEYLPATSKKRSGLYVQQYRFLKLLPRVNYEPVAMALKGVQIAVGPGTFMTATQYAHSRRHRVAFDELANWGADPTPVTAEERERFLQAVYTGLMAERRGKPAHTEAYIAWTMAELNLMLDEFNDQVRPRPHGPEEAPAGHQQG